MKCPSPSGVQFTTDGPGRRGVSHLLHEVGRVEPGHDAVVAGGGQELVEGQGLAAEMILQSNKEQGGRIRQVVKASTFETAELFGLLTHRHKKTLLRD